MQIEHKAHMRKKILNPIKSRKYENFVIHLDSIVVPVVKEFYANAIEHKDYRDFVRGKWVLFDRTTIN